MYQRTFIVVFKPAEKESWWLHFIDRSFAHCFLATYLGNESSLKIDPTEGGTGIYEIKIPLEDLAVKYRDQGWKVAVFTAREEAMVKPRLKFFRSCVGVCKDFLGIKKWWIVTPKQLYREVNHEWDIRRR